MGRIRRGVALEESSNCRICGQDTASGRRLEDANGYRYCANCYEDLRRQPPYQSPLFKCDTCARAWPVRSLLDRGGRLVCNDCAAGGKSVAKHAGGGGNVDPSGGAHAQGTAHAAPGASPAGAGNSKQASLHLGPLPTNILPRVTCLHCWHVFPIDQVLWVSQHAELMGDPVLGPEAPARFRASRFNADGEALDARDMPCQVLACPRCHLTIPHSMIETAPLFVSFIGAPASGKSHFLGTMSWELRRVLRETFGVTFNDADTVFNLILNEYEETLFLQEDADRLVAIRKTEMQGDLYDQIRLGEHVVSLPKPFLFTLRNNKPARRSVAGAAPLLADAAAPDAGGHVVAPLASAAPRLRMICLYDNAGEHFQPGMDSAASPGTQHLAKSRVLWFMFDPTQSPRFRQQCRPLSQDPQLHNAQRTHRQEVLLTEAAARVRRYTGLSAQKQHDRPLVVIVSKADIWGQLLGIDLAREPLMPDPANPSLKAVDMDRVEATSAAVRELLLTLTPEFVAAAEDFCKHVVYIPVSALGRGPDVQPETGMLGIRSKDIHPQWVTVPVLYMFARWGNGWLPGARQSAGTSEPAVGDAAAHALASNAPTKSRPLL